MFTFGKPSTLPAPEEALPGRPEPILEPGRHVVLGTPIAGPYPAGFGIAEFALGCFWGEEQTFWKVPGVWTTAVGYQGGYTPNPTYQEVCTGRTGHAESVRVVFDPSKVSYDDLLRVFWESHDPTQGMRQGNDVGTQYRSAIYYTTPEQEQVARDLTKVYGDELRRRRLGEITTEIREVPTYYYAEDLHQQYLAKNPHGYRCHANTGVKFPETA
ncbi:MAG TPA: peptide-methionine (S)-S-oxide reductase MsrA [Candidatus Limnocylindrales bacterium]|nr:peptide-methionine (S)-S-oxide reductase MsrA [Candidatus Limnocylindrales bacterium]